MNKSEFRKHTVINLPGVKEIEFYHNLPDTFGMNIDGAVVNWIMRTSDHSVESLAKYVASKSTGHKILTVKQYEKLK